MSRSRFPNTPPRQDHTATIITISVLVAIMVLLGVALMWLAVQNGLAFAPTPTPTATSGPVHTPTPNVPATHVAEDMLTQVAFAATLVGGLTPGALPTAQAESPEQLTVEATSNIRLPFVAAPGAPPVTEIAVSLTPVSTVVYMPSVENAGPPTPTQPPPPAPVATPIPFVPVTPIATVFPPTPAFPTPGFPTPAFPTPIFPTPIVPTPIPSPVIQPSPTPPFPVSYELVATMRGSDTAVRIGPSNVYTITGNMPANTGIRVRGRTPAGDWVYACCLPNTSDLFWVRRAYVNLVNNVLPPGAPEGSDPNDTRWVAVQPPDISLFLRATPTAIPLGDFPLARYDSQNSGHVTALPAPPLQTGWNVSSQAAGAFVSPAAVSGPSVLALSQDNQLYSLDLNAGNQRWRHNLQSVGQFAPSLQDGLIYVIAGGRSIFSLQDQNNQAGLVWQSDLPLNATSPFNIWLDTLLVGVGDGGDARLLAIRRSNPADRREFNEPNGRVQQPAIGQETIFVGADRLWAIDINLWLGQEIAWTSTDVFNVVAPPVYAFPGVAKLAELYAADAGGTVHALDANTGTRIWAHSFGGPVTALAVNESSLFIVGNGLIRAVLRQNGQTQWTQPINGLAMGGPLVTGNRVLVVTQSGGINFFDAVNGGLVDAASSVPGQVPGGPAVSGAWLLVPASNTSTYAYRGIQ